MDVPYTTRGEPLRCLPAGDPCCHECTWRALRESPGGKARAIGKAERYVFDNFLFISRRVGKGSRLRLLVHCLNSITVQKNYNSGGVVADETARDARTAHVTLHHDAEHPSALELPVVKP